MRQLDGVILGGFRSFPSDKPVRLTNLGKVNLIAGQNNSGKSNVLRGIQKMVDEVAARIVEPTDRPYGDAEHKVRSGFALQFETVVASLQAVTTLDITQKNRLLRGALASPLLLENDLVWFEYDGWASTIDRRNLSMEWYESLRSSTTREMDAAASRLLGELRMNRGGDNVFTLMGLLAGTAAFPGVEMISGFREIRHDVDLSLAGGETETDLNGKNLRWRLQRLQNPRLGQLGDRAKFDSINGFVRSVLEDPTISVDIPHDLSTIHVTQRGVTLPIESVGTGIHEVVILAAAATVIENSIVCIEEPEIHLHPVLQRKLLRYLATETSNQYFIATHSAHMLDSTVGSIHHVQLVDGGSEVNSVGDPKSKSRVCVDLGYRPSDLVQSNAVIWVEGPSDRIYIKKWIEALFPNEFVEGVHYSIMFYGGGLLSNLTPDDPDEVQEFISLRALNRYMIVVIDSDKTEAGQRINQSKRLVRDTLAKDPRTGHAWITAGYTIENYVPWDLLSAALRATHPSSTARRSPGQYVNPLSKGRTGLKSSPNKSKIARHVVENWRDEWPLDLKPRVSAIARLIREANRTA